MFTYHCQLYLTARPPGHGRLGARATAARHDPGTPAIAIPWPASARTVRELGHWGQEEQSCGWQSLGQRPPGREGEALEKWST